MANHLLMIGTSELLLIAALVLLLFGGKKLPEMMKGLGQGVRSFKDGMREVTEPEDDNAAKQTTSSAGKHDDAKKQPKDAHQVDPSIDENDGKGEYSEPTDDIRRAS